MRDDSGHVVGVVGIGTDVSRIKWKEEEFTRFTDT